MFSFLILRLDALATLDEYPDSTQHSIHRSADFAEIVARRVIVVAVDQRTYLAGEL